MGDTLRTHVVPFEVVRLDGHSLELGVSVEYRLKGFQFRILASRDGVIIEGKSPWFTEVALANIEQLMQRAKVHHAHLAAFPVGVKQEALNEDQVQSAVAFIYAPRN